MLSLEVEQSTATNKTSLRINKNLLIRILHLRVDFSLWESNARVNAWLRNDIRNDNEWILVATKKAETKSFTKKVIFGCLRASNESKKTKCSYTGSFATRHNLQKILTICMKSTLCL